MSPINAKYCDWFKKIYTNCSEIQNLQNLCLEFQNNANLRKSDKTSHCIFGNWWQNMLIWKRTTCKDKKVVIKFCLWARCLNIIKICGGYPQIWTISLASSQLILSLTLICLWFIYSKALCLFFLVGVLEPI